MPEPSRRRRYLILAICCMSLLLVGLDNTIVNVALPSIRRELNASVSGLQWTVAAYTLVLASLLMLSGSTADPIGRRRVFQTGLVTFTAGSLLCSLAPSLGWLIAFRMVQAVGGSMLNPVAMSIITNTFTDRAERARAIGIWGGVIGISMALGPVLGRTPARRGSLSRARAVGAVPGRRRGWSRHAALVGGSSSSIRTRGSRRGSLGQTAGAGRARALPGLERHGGRGPRDGP